MHNKMKTDRTYSGGEGSDKQIMRERRRQWNEVRHREREKERERELIERS